MSSRPRAKRHRIDVFDEFKVVVGKGEGQKTVHVAKMYLTKSSDYLKTACGKAWKEGQTKTIELPDFKPDTFAIYLQCLQTGEIVVTDEETPAKDAEASVREAYWNAVAPTLTEVYALADYLADTPMRNLVINEWMAASNVTSFGPSTPTVMQIYESTSSNCTLRRIFVDWYVANIEIEWITENSAKCHPEFLADMVVEYTRLRDEKEPPTAPKKREKCYYHEHDEEHPKCM